MNGMGGPGSLEELSRTQLRAALLSEFRASLVAVAFSVFLWVAVVRDPILLLLSAAIMAMSLLRNRGFPAIDAGDIERAVAYFIVGKWLISLVLVLVLPIALPIIVVNLIMPIVIGSTHLRPSRFVPLTVAVVIVALIIGTAGYMVNILELDARIDDWIWQVLCVVVLTAHFVPMSLILWRTNQQQSLISEEALRANEQLRVSQAELVQSRQRLVAAADEERSRIERDLHDGVQQRLVSVLVQLRLQDQLAERGTAVDASQRRAVIEELEAATAEVRQLAHGIYPPLLEMSGLASALMATARSGGHTIEAEGVGRYDRAIESAVYFCCSEAMQNATKHGGIGVTVRVHLEQHETTFVGRVEDDGPGFDAAVAGLGRGLDNMRDRINAVDGLFDIRSRPGGGTVVEFEIPVVTVASGAS